MINGSPYPGAIINRFSLVNHRDEQETMIQAKSCLIRVKGACAMSQQNKDIVRRSLDLFNQGDLETSSREIFHPDLKVTFPGQPSLLSREAYQQLGGAYLRAFPGCKITVLDQVAEGDCVVTRILYEGTHTGPLLDIEPTGRSVCINGVLYDRFQDGRLVERWEFFDQMDMLMQLGVISLPAKA
jgi:predicted ester cyclase